MTFRDTFLLRRKMRGGKEVQTRYNEGGQVPFAAGEVFREDSYPLCQCVPFVRQCPISHLTPWNKPYTLIRTEHLMSSLSG